MNRHGLAERGVIEPMIRSTTLKYVGVLALLVGAYSVLPIWKEHSPYRDVGDIPAEIHVALTLVIGWLLVFRTNAAYSRWWEARTLWGSLVNATRNLTVKIVDMVDVPADEIREAGRDVIGFPYALRDHLRDESDLAKVPGFADESATPVHVPTYLVARRYDALRRWKSMKWIDGDDQRVIDRELAQLLDICGACERIRYTRIVRSYRMFARQCVVMFLATLPWGIVGDFGVWTIPLTVITAYFMLGLEIVAEHIEEPFGYDEDDLDLDGLCTTITRSIEEIIERRASRR